METLITMAKSTAFVGALAAMFIGGYHHAVAPVADVEPAGCTAADAYAREVGDDNCDGRIDEDESGFDCAVMGNRVCGAALDAWEDAVIYSGALEYQ